MPRQGQTARQTVVFFFRSLIVLLVSQMFEPDFGFEKSIENKLFIQLQING